MDTERVSEHADVALFRPRGERLDRRPADPRFGSSADYVLMLQRAVGNSAVSGHLTGMSKPKRQSSTLAKAPQWLVVQRCGPVPCDCNDQQHAQHADSERDEEKRRPTERPGIQRTLGGGGLALQRLPGDGMVPPGDCAWSGYLPLRLSVESAKAVVSMVGACGPGDSCTLLAMKIAAITAEIAARVALDTTCFRGGDTGHRQQVQDKVNMVNRCHRFFVDSDCPQSLVTAMQIVVMAARRVIEAAAVAAAAAVVVAAVAALVAAITALIEVIAAAIAVAAEAAVIAAAAAALAALLAVVSENLASPAPEAPEGA